ncbi:MAG: ankyrin repeat domain-containing protein [Sedimenticola sp.]
MPIVIAILVSFLLIGCEKIEEKMEGEELFQAIEDGNYLLVKIILNVQPNLVNVRDEYEMTPLMASVSSSERSVDIIEKIILSGADVNDKTSEGYTPLHMMVDVNGPSGTGSVPYEIANLLVKYGADIEIRQHWGWTPLMRAALEGTDDEFKAILNVSANTIVSYPESSLPEFTRGVDLLEIVLSEPIKVRALVDSGFPVTEKHVKAAETRIEEALAEENSGKINKEWSDKYISNIKQSIQLVKNAIKP